MNVLTEDCQEIQMILPWVLNGSLEAKVKVKVFSHLSHCSGCRKEFSSWIALHQSMEAVQGEEEMDMEDTQALLCTIQKQTAPQFETILCKNTPDEALQHVVKGALWKVKHGTEESCQDVVTMLKLGKRSLQLVGKLICI